MTDIFADAPRTKLSERDFASIGGILQAEARISLAPSKITMTEARLSRRLRLHGLTDFGDYVRFVKRDSDELREMVTALTTNHTHFFRESHHFDFLEQELIAPLRAKAEARRPVRIWSAGCSSGEEVHSIAMTLAGRTRAEGDWVLKRDVRFLATDISPPVVQKASEGTYSLDTARDVPAPYRKTWMRDEKGEVVVDADLRSRITARVLNLFGPWPMRQTYDVIFCRNTMIYFDEPATADLQERFAELLAPGGFLFIGHSERLHGSAAQTLVPVGQTIYQKPGADA